jgi:hypothetical protein
MSHARLTFIIAPLMVILVSGCASPGWFTGGEFASSRQRRAVEQLDESPIANSEASHTAPAVAPRGEPSLAQFLADPERFKQQNPADFQAIQSAVEDTSHLLPPQYQQLYKDQMQGVALSQQQQSPQVFPDQTGAPAMQHVQPPELREPMVQTPYLAPSAAVSSPQLPMSSNVAPASYATDLALAAIQSPNAVHPAAGVTASIGDMPTQVPALAPTTALPQASAEQAPLAAAPAAITAATATAAAATAEEVPEPGQWNREVERALASLNADLARPNLNRDEKTRLEIMRRLLYVVTNRRDEAVSPIDQLDEDEQEYWKHQLHGLLVSTDADGKHPTTRRAALALRHLRTATDHLANVSTLDVGNLTFCKEVLSYGDYRVFDSYSFRAKAEVVMYVEIDNFAAHPRGDSFETELHSSYEIVDDAGRRVANVVLPVDKQVSNNRRRDYFIAYLITMPSQIAPGSYRLQLTVEDVIGKKSNHAAIDFRIQ